MQRDIRLTVVVDIIQVSVQLGAFCTGVGLQRGGIHLLGTAGRLADIVDRLGLHPSVLGVDQPLAFVYLDEGISKDALKEKINPMQDEADGIEARIAVYESIKSKEDGIENIKKYLQAQKQKLEHADNKVKQGLIDAFVQRVTVYDDHFDLVLTVDSDKDGGGEGS